MLKRHRKDKRRFSLSIPSTRKAPTSTEIVFKQDKALTPIVEIIDDKIVTSTLNVAEVFGKGHKHVLDAVRALDVPKEFIEPNFRPNTYKDTIGRSLPYYNLTRDGFILLVMGFTGKKAMRLKLAYIDKFNELEQRVLRPVANPYVTMNKVEVLAEALKIAQENELRSPR